MKRWILAVPVMVVVLAACGGGGSDAAASQGDDSVIVTTTDNSFDPASITAASGSAIEVVNEGEAPHNFSVAGSGIDVDVEPGESVMVDTTDLGSGNHTVECKFHADAGMTATLDIEA